MLRALRHACRLLRQSRGFATIAILTLALGIGANTAVFTLVYAVMLSPLPVSHAHELYRVGDDDSCCVMTGLEGPHFSIFSYPLYRYLRDHTSGFSDMAAFQVGLAPVTVSRSSAPALSYTGELVSGNYFSTLGVDAFRGRTLTSADDNAAAPPAAVMSYRVWDRFYARNPSAVGSTVVINGVPVTIIGIAPRSFFGETLRSNPPGFWLPLALEPALKKQNSLLAHSDQHWLYILGRIKSGAQPRTVEATLNVELQQWFQGPGAGDTAGAPPNEVARQHVALTSAISGVGLLRMEYEDSLHILLAVSGLVLLMACANIANLLLARAAANQIQISLRRALGASRFHLLRQTMTESLLLALLGGLAGVFLASIGARAILLIAFAGAQYVPINPEPSQPVLFFALLLSILTAAVFGIVPALLASRSDPADALRGANRSTARHATLTQRSFIVLQAALSLVLLCAAALLAQSLRNLEHQSFGFDPQNRVVAGINPASAGYTPERLAGLYRQLEEKLNQIPGVLSASFSLYAPLAGGPWVSGVSVEGHTSSSASFASGAWNRVSPHYFKTIGTPLIQGRVIDERDRPDAVHVAVINSAFADKFFKNQNPIGKHLGLGRSAGLDCQIVGVVADAKYADVREPARPMFFLALLQMPPAAWSDSAMVRSNYVRDLQLHTAPHLQNVEPLLRRAVASVDPNIAVIDVRSFSDRVSLNFNRERLIARLAEISGLLALALASVGLYGVTGYSVAQRTSEIGIRMALGAARAQVVVMILRGALAQIAVGLLIGVPIAIAANRVLTHELFHVSADNPLILASAMLLLSFCATLAGLIPARRGASIDPLEALRSE